MNIKKIIEEEVKKQLKSSSKSKLVEENLQRNFPKFYEEIKEDFLDRVEEFEGVSIDELHHEMYNMDYYIIGTNKAEKWLGEDTWAAIELVKNYEEDNFGKMTTPIEPERIANTVAYIIGEEVIYDTKSYRNSRDYGDVVTAEFIEDIKKELK